MTIILISLGLIFIILGMILATKNMKPMHFNLVAGIIILIGTLFGLFGKLNQDKNSSEKSDNILTTSKSTNNEILNLKTQNEDLIKHSAELISKAEKQAETIDKLRIENTELYSKLSHSSTEIYNNITGGNSFCKAEVGNINNGNDIGMLIYNVEGKYPLSHISSRIVDLNTEDFKSVTIESLDKNVEDLGTLEPNKGLVSKYRLTLNKALGVNLNIFFGANNGFVNQLIRMRFTNGSWKRATRVRRGNEIIFEEVDKDYPMKNLEEIFK